MATATAERANADTTTPREDLIEKTGLGELSKLVKNEDLLKIANNLQKIVSGAENIINVGERNAAILAVYRRLEDAYHTLATNYKDVEKVSEYFAARAKHSVECAIYGQESFRAFQIRKAVKKFLGGAVKYVFSLPFKLLGSDNTVVGIASSAALAAGGLVTVSTTTLTGIGASMIAIGSILALMRAIFGKVTEGGDALGSNYDD